MAFESFPIHELDALQAKAVEIDELRDFVASEEELGMERQADPMAGDQYWDQAYFEAAAQARAKIEEIKSTIPSLNQ